MQRKQRKSSRAWLYFIAFGPYVLKSSVCVCLSFWFDVIKCIHSTAARLSRQVYRSRSLERVECKLSFIIECSTKSKSNSVCVFCRYFVWFMRCEWLVQIEREKKSCYLCKNLYIQKYVVYLDRVIILNKSLFTWTSIRHQRIKEDQQNLLGWNTISEGNSVKIQQNGCLRPTIWLKGIAPSAITSILVDWYKTIFNKTSK